MDIKSVVKIGDDGYNTRLIHNQKDIENYYVDKKEFFKELHSVCGVLRKSDYFKLRLNYYNPNLKHRWYYNRVLESEFNSGNLKASGIKARLNELMCINFRLLFSRIYMKNIDTSRFHTRNDIRYYLENGEFRPKDSLPVTSHPPEIQRIKK